MDTMVVVVAIAAVAIMVILGLAWWLLQTRRRAHLRDRFGPEYDRTLQHAGDVRKAEATLTEREKRVAKLRIRPLSSDEAAHFLEVWHHVQTLFVDDPRGAIGEADRLVNDVMNARGYPVADFDQRVADISVDHPVVVEQFRAARAIAQRHERGEATTEDLRQAVVHYRTLFDELLERKPLKKVEVAS
jgi:hypothetical protein